MDILAWRTHNQPHLQITDAGFKINISDEEVQGLLQFMTTEHTKSSEQKIGEDLVISYGHFNNMFCLLIILPGRSGFVWKNIEDVPAFINKLQFKEGISVL